MCLRFINAFISSNADVAFCHLVCRLLFTCTIEALIAAEFSGAHTPYTIGSVSNFSLARNQINFFGLNYELLLPCLFRITVLPHFLFLSIYAHFSCASSRLLACGTRCHTDYKNIFSWLHQKKRFHFHRHLSYLLKYLQDDEINLQNLSGCNYASSGLFCNNYFSCL